MKFQLNKPFKEGIFNKVSELLVSELFFLQTLY